MKEKWLPFGFCEACWERYGRPVGMGHKPRPETEERD